MSDGPPAATAPQRAWLNSPPVQSASQFALAMTLAEVTFTFGQVRQIIDPSSGAPGAQAAVEWLLSVAMPLPTAVIMRDGLTAALAEYEKRYGPIPHDPTMTPTIENKV